MATMAHISSTAFFITSVPTATRQDVRRCRHQCNLVPTATANTSPSPQPSQNAPKLRAACIPTQAAAIEDEAAQAMLQALQYTPIQTNLPQATIYTSHCVTGPTSVPNLVFLHGFDSNLLEYRYVFSELVDAPVRAHYVDILGWGLTERPIDAEFSYGPRSKREHLHAFIEHMCGTGALYLVGASVGGAVAIDYALTFPNRVAGLVLVDAQAFIEKKESAMMKIPGMAGIGAEILRSDWLRRLAINLSYENKRFKTDDVLRIGGLHCRMPGWKEAAVDFIKGEGYCVRDKVANINCRTLVIWGENDRVLPKANANKFVDTIHGCQLHFVTECGHSPHIEKPTLLTRHILQFVASAPAN